MGDVRNQIGYNHGMKMREEPYLRGELLHYQQDAGPATLLVGSPAWFDWLQKARRFTIEVPEGRISVRKERAGNQRGGWYWRAYRKARGRLRRFYLGDDAELSAGRIAQSVAALLDPDPHSAPSQGPNGSEHATLVRTKLVPPHQPGQLVPRPALLALLQAKLDAPLTLLIAPPGFGKTTLLTQLVARLGDASNAPALQRPAWAWLTLESGDSPPERMVRALAAALEPAQPGAAALPHAATPEAGLAGMLNALAGRRDPLLLILDDYHTLGAEAHTLVGQLIERAPAQLHVVIAGREDPPLPLARLRAGGRLSELRGPELAFQGEETAALVRLVSGQDLAPTEIATLEERTEGWAAGLRLAGLALRGQADPRRFTMAFAGTHRFVMDYLIDEVLRQQPPQLLQFLLETSVLERLSAPLCDALRGMERGDSQALLDEAERRGLFLVALDDEHRWYRYHSLFAEVLRAELRRMAGPERLAQLREAAARWQATHLWPSDSGLAPMVEQLTAREHAVLGLAAAGATNAQIAERLHIAVSTVKAHINSIFGKLDARSRTQAIARAREQGLLR